LSSKAKKYLHESLHQQHLNQKLAEYNEAKKLFMSLMDLDYKPAYREYIFYKYWLASRPERAMDQRSETLSPLKDHGHTSSSDRNNIVLLDAYQPEEIYS
ncbi:794_t:CDS:1, partial [Racocetra persica]